MRQLIEDLISMMEYHVEQTRPIHTTTVALQAAREALKSLPAQPVQEPVTWGVDWGKAGDIPCVSIIKRLPDGGIYVMAVEYAPYSYTTPPAINDTLKEKNT
jgi:hypothetical protein